MDLFNFFYAVFCHFIRLNLSNAEFAPALIHFGVLEGFDSGTGTVIGHFQCGVSEGCDSRTVVVIAKRYHQAVQCNVLGNSSSGRDWKELGLPPGSDRRMQHDG